MKKIPISVVILTYNEEKNIEDCFRSVYSWVNEIFLVDSFSTDRTIEIAKRYTDKIYQHLFENHAKQWNWAFSNLPFSYDWCLALDADQRVTEKLQEELWAIFKNNPAADIDGYYVRRQQIFRGKPIRFGGYQNKYLLKLFKFRSVYSDEYEFVDFRFYVKGKTAKLKSFIIENNLNDYNITFWLEKHNHFSTLQAQEEILRRQNRLKWQISPSWLGSPDEKVLLYKSIYYKLPLYIRPLLYFLYRYIILLGFLDGKEGFIYHFLQGLWYRLIVDIKIGELIRKFNHNND